jgi:hypothetical protein
MNVVYPKFSCDFTNKVGVFEERDEVSVGTFLRSYDIGDWKRRSVW